MSGRLPTESGPQKEEYIRRTREARHMGGTTREARASLFAWPVIEVLRRKYEMLPGFVGYN